VSYLIDINILTRVIVIKDALSPVAGGAIDVLQERGEQLLVAPQNLMEFWVVATQPREANGLGLAVEGVRKEIERFEGMFGILDESPAVYRRFRAYRAASTITRPRPRLGLSSTTIRISRCSAVRKRMRRSIEKSSSRPR
jgi:hypothetical protein